MARPGDKIPGGALPIDTVIHDLQGLVSSAKNQATDAADFKDYSYAVMIYRLAKPRCAGTIIHPKGVLTTCSCVSCVRNAQSLQRVKIYYGSANFNDMSTMMLEAIHKHSNCDTYNIAYIKTKEEFSKSVKRLSISPLKTSQIREKGLNNCKYAGWGASHEKINIIQSMVQVFLNNINFTEALVPALYKFNNTQFVCADDGGAIICKDKLVGIIMNKKKCADYQTNPNEKAKFLYATDFVEWSEIQAQKKCEYLSHVQTAVLSDNNIKSTIVKSKEDRLVFCIPSHMFFENDEYESSEEIVDGFANFFKSVYEISDNNIVTINISNNSSSHIHLNCFQENDIKKRFHLLKITHPVVMIKFPVSLLKIAIIC
ncbi:unnamed protein product [Brassicogethes aeneus]|uniref:Peptidase S1 domain-containing protein n=1 Tax=Brassicogethes aeneus TaxID=1431903 RepID=A0A9P0B023_BRAAE|nr:unnamed protein product [Brassicogethes aeneus]